MTEKQSVWIGCLLLAAAVALIAAGGWLGQSRPVFLKAVNICLECIGVG